MRDGIKRNMGIGVIFRIRSLNVQGLKQSPLVILNNERNGHKVPLWKDFNRGKGKCEGVFPRTNEDGDRGVGVGVGVGV